MGLRSYQFIMAAAVVLFATTACGTHAVPSSDGAIPTLQTLNDLKTPVHPADTTSILKELTKDVVIGSTVDPTNGDQGPRALSVVPACACVGTLKSNDLLVCNFDDSNGTSGNGTTMEVLAPKAGSNPVRFTQNAALKGCDGTAIQPHDGSVYGSGLSSGKILELTKKGQLVKTYSSKTIKAPLYDTAADHQQNFSPLYIYSGETTQGGIISISIGFYGNGLATQVAKGFAVSQSGGEELGPGGLQDDKKLDTLYIVDGANNTIVAFTNVSKLLAKDEIIIQPGGKTFSCKYPKTSCATLVYSGSPLNAPVATALLPNGNLIVANTQGTANTLVELTPAGQILDTEVVDTSSTQGVFGLAAKGTTDANTVLYYSDANTNTVHELTR